MRICLEQSAFPGVIRVTEKVAHDVELVSGKKPQILVEKEIPETLESSGEDWTIIAATKGKSSFLKKLVHFFSRSCSNRILGVQRIKMFNNGIDYPISIVEHLLF